jgi:glycosyltransferase involved in cell wall biosynthesis
VSPYTGSERLLVLIPAYNEQAAIRGVVCSVRQIMPQADILVVDDSSGDNTAQEAEAAGAFVLRHPINLGIGGTVQTGLKFAWWADYDAVIRLDGDGQHNASDIPMLYAILQTGQADVVIGSRFLSSTQEMHIPFSRRLGIHLFAGMVSLLTGVRATDTTSGFFAVNRRAIQALAVYMPQDYPEVESRIVLHKAGLTTLELPARMRARLSGVSSIDNWRSIYYALKVSVAVAIGALKDIPASPKEMVHADTD